MSEKQFKKNGKKLRQGDSWTSKKFQEGVSGKVVSVKAGKKKNQRFYWQPLPVDGAKAFHFQLEPGKVHSKTLDTWAAYPTVFSAPRSVLEALLKPTERKEGHKDNRPILDCLNPVTKSRSVTQSKTCVGRRFSTGLVLRGIVVIHGKRSSDGSFKVRKGGGLYYRCVYGVQNTILEDSDLIGCKHGLHGNGSFVWILNRVKMTDCSIHGYGKTHCIYSSPPKEGVSVHEKI